MEKLSNGQSAFAEGANRLGDVARTVKSQHVSEVQGASLQSPRMSVIAPDEVWAKKFMNQGIGPAPDMIGVSGMTPMPHTTFVMAEVAPPRISVGDAVKRTAPIERAPMSARINVKPEQPKRSWLGRLFRSA